jgi:hypothetical protein
MNRPRKIPGSKSVQVSFSVSESEYQAVKQAAMSSKVSMSEWIRGATKAAVQMSIEHRRPAFQWHNSREQDNLNYLGDADLVRFPARALADAVLGRVAVGVLANAERDLNAGTINQEDLARRILADYDRRVLADYDRRVLADHANDPSRNT